MVEYLSNDHSRHNSPAKQYKINEINHELMFLEMKDELDVVDKKRMKRLVEERLKLEGY